MKIYTDLYPRICDFENLRLAYRAARKGKRDKQQVVAFEFEAESELIRLRDELISRTYKPGAYANFRLEDRKRRLISAAPFRDRVVHHALCQIIEPLFERQFIFDSYANRIGKGTHRALDRAQKFCRRYRYVFQGDLVQFFPSVDHAILRGILAQTIADDETLGLIDQILASGAYIHTDEYRMQWFPGDDLFAVNRPRGLPIGNLTSQFWGNVYLTALDQFVKRELKCHAYVRYVDDFLLFVDDKRTLWEWKERVADFLQSLRLVMHPRKSVVYPAHTGIPFLGWRIFRTHRRLKRENVRDFSRRFRRQTAAYQRGEISLADLSVSTQSWIAHAAHGDTYRLRARLFRAMPITFATNSLSLSGRG
ncbi:MAG: RNA-dependent DNA polymerase [Chloroflexi bacterium]|nr:RNA-dependent DNA polymerase [Chloroflexota bacterium]